jgi:hypothetical protein
MSLFRPIHWYHPRAALICPVGPFRVESKCICSSFFKVAQRRQRDVEIEGIIFEIYYFYRWFIVVELQIIQFMYFYRYYFYS